ncbi:hypothetical protein GCM10028805_14340 [Spirosoma harenae]
MKKTIFLTVGLLLFTLASFAQVRVGLTGGVQLANQKNDLGGISINGSNRIGFMAGLLLDASIAGNLSIRPQILYSVKGTKFNLGALTGGTVSGGDIDYSLNYLEVPIQLTYGLEAGPGKVVLGAGPYVGYAINGKVSGAIQGQSASESVEFGSGEDQLKRIDYGLRLSAGYELTSGLTISGYYSPGLGNLANGSDGSTKNTAFGLALGFLFGGE